MYQNPFPQQHIKDLEPTKCTIVAQSITFFVGLFFKLVLNYFQFCLNTAKLNLFR